MHEKTVPRTVSRLSLCRTFNCFEVVEIDQSAIDMFAKAVPDRLRTFSAMYLVLS